MPVLHRALKRYVTKTEKEGNDVGIASFTDAESAAEYLVHVPATPGWTFEIGDAPSPPNGYWKELERTG